MSSSRSSVPFHFLGAASPNEFQPNVSSAIEKGNAATRASRWQRQQIQYHASSSQQTKGDEDMGVDPISARQR